MIRLQRQVSYFGYPDGLEGLMRHVGDEEINKQILSALWEERAEEHIPYKQFDEWPEAADDAFRELIKGSMSLDPRKRLTAAQILKLPWFSAKVDQ
jgi:serine/threonine protein kinase